MTLLQRTEHPIPVLSIVMPVLNEARDIRTLLGTILRQEPPTGGFEVLVADGGSTDSTCQIVREISADHPQVTLLDNLDRRSSAGRNVGARAARGRYILFIDGHCHIPRQDYLKRLVEIFESSGADCLCRPQPLDRFPEGKWARAIAAARHSWLGHNMGSDIYGGEPGFVDPRSAGAAYTRKCFNLLGGYDERFDACEDVEFNCRVDRARMLSYLHPDLAIPYRPRSSLGALFRQMVRYGRGRANLMAKHPSEAPWALVLLTLCILCYAVFAWVLLTSNKYSPELIGIPILLWFAATAGTACRAAQPQRDMPRVFLAIATIHLGLVLGFWRGLGEIRRFRGV